MQEAGLWSCSCSEKLQKLKITVSQKEKWDLTAYCAMSVLQSFMKHRKDRKEQYVFIVKAFHLEKTFEVAEFCFVQT